MYKFTYNDNIYCILAGVGKDTEEYRRTHGNVVFKNANDIQVDVYLKACLKKDVKFRIFNVFDPSFINVTVDHVDIDAQMFVGGYRDSDGVMHDVEAASEGLYIDGIKITAEGVELPKEEPAVVEATPKNPTHEVPDTTDVDAEKVWIEPKPTPPTVTEVSESSVDTEGSEVTASEAEFATMTYIEPVTPSPIINYGDDVVVESEYATEINPKEDFMNPPEVQGPAEDFMNLPTTGSTPLTGIATVKDPDRYFVGKTVQFCVKKPSIPVQLRAGGDDKPGGASLGRVKIEIPKETEAEEVKEAELETFDYEPNEEMVEETHEIAEEVNTTEEPVVDKAEARKLFRAKLPNEVATVIGDIPRALLGSIAEFTAKPVNTALLETQGAMYCVDHRWHKCGNWYCIDIVGEPNMRYFFNGRYGASLPIEISVLKEWEKLIGNEN